MLRKAALDARAELSAVGAEVEHLTAQLEAQAKWASNAIDDSYKPVGTPREEFEAPAIQLRPGTAPVQYDVWGRKLPPGKKNRAAKGLLRKSSLAAKAAVALENRKPPPVLLGGFR